MTRTFDWRPSPHPDPRRRDFAARALTSTRTSRYWHTGPILDQGEEGACVGHGVTAAIIASPSNVRLPHPQQTAFGMDYGSRRIDSTEGEDYDGTDVDAGMRLARELGLISGWEWCFTPSQLRYTVLEQGPVVCGLWLEESFQETDPEGLVDVEGGLLGGHCMLVTAYSAHRTFARYEGPVYQLANSWSAAWGRRGFLYLRAKDLEAKFYQDGEFAIHRV